jgi:RND family efflux transporter MFP subunit
MERAGIELSREQKEYQRIKAIEEAGGSYEKEKKDVYANYKKALGAFNAAKQMNDFYKNGMVITSPISGYVTSLTRFPGNAVRMGELLISIVDLENLLAEVEVFGPDTDSIKAGQPVIITGDKGEIPGKVSFISTEINPETGGRKVGIGILQKKTRKLLPGDFVKADIIIERHLSTLAIPEGALLNDKGQKVVMVKVRQTYEKRNIVTGLYDQGYAEVLDGLSEGEEVVTMGAYELLNREIREKIQVED